MPTPDTETNKNFCEFAKEEWFYLFENHFDNVVSALADADASWDMIAFDKNPDGAILIVERGSFIAGYRIVRYAAHYKDVKGCLYGFGGRYSGGFPEKEKLLAENADFLVKLARALKVSAEKV